MNKRRLLLFRHAKSDWNATFGQDLERPLNERGRAAARRMGEILAAGALVPPRALISPARRARETYELAAKAGGWSCESTIEERLYESSPDRVLSVIREQPDAVESLLLVGHEPTWSELAGALIGGASVRFSTATIARIDFRVESWKALAYDRGVLAWLLQPKLFTRSR